MSKGPRYKTISGKTSYYRDWLAEVLAEADKVNLSDATRMGITEAMLKQAWKNAEYPTVFIQKQIEYFGS